MAKKSAGNKKKSPVVRNQVETALKGVTGPSRPPLTKMVEDGLRVQVFGQVKNGKVQIDQSSLEEIARKFPNARMAFVAVNAPFDPVPHRE